MRSIVRHGFGVCHYDERPAMSISLGTACRSSALARRALVSTYLQRHTRMKK